MQRLFIALAESSSSEESFLNNAVGLVGMMALTLSATVTLFTMLGKIRADIAELKMEVQKDKEHLESKLDENADQISRNKEDCHLIRNRLTTILLTLAEKGINVNTDRWYDQDKQNRNN